MDDSKTLLLKEEIERRDSVLQRLVIYCQNLTIAKHHIFMIVKYNTMADDGAPTTKQEKISRTNEEEDGADKMLLLLFLRRTATAAAASRAPSGTVDQLL